ncbi:hypothetical protein [Thalassoglobus polymorphus]|uniref:Secreted protein n=1 Tax=Thalassoglobus polymorphus TaxID=2527994 RepID=A0A517QLS1_9PLAN|nr:hypothetical protein [Thalassoglobus polymorphus]QDT32576.1 hypothetical protein Mal48_18230 [Thalassoglobus polymorphus]
MNFHIRLFSMLFAFSLQCTFAFAADLQLATFHVDVTPPIGDGPCVGFMQKIESIEHPLEMRGVLIRNGEEIFVVAAIDYCGICGSSDETIRSKMAQAAGTSLHQVALQSLHQHTAPVLDADGMRVLFGDESPELKRHQQFTEEIASRASKGIIKAKEEFQSVSRIIGTRAEVREVASNRRVPQDNGSLGVRSSLTSDLAIRNAPEGLIDPWLRTVTFFNGETSIAQLHYYATHPQSFYGDARISWDTVGIARERFEKETGVFQVYFNGCGGNVTVGKYNDGTRAARKQLSANLHDAMLRSTQKINDHQTDVTVNVSSLSNDEVYWQSIPVNFTPRDDGPFHPVALEQQLATNQRFSTRLKAAMYTAFRDCLQADRKVQASRMRIGEIDLINLPGEPFVEFQLFAQQIAPKSSFVCVAGYGECGVWYFGPDHIYTDRGGYEQTWSFTGPCEEEVQQTLSRLLKR